MHHLIYKKELSIFNIMNFIKQKRKNANNLQATEKKTSKTFQSHFSHFFFLSIRSKVLSKKFFPKELYYVLMKCF